MKKKRKVKLVRRGKVVGIVNWNFHKINQVKEEPIWNELELPMIGVV